MVLWLAHAQISRFFIKILISVDFFKLSYIPVTFLASSCSPIEQIYFFSSPPLQLTKCGAHTKCTSRDYLTRNKIPLFVDRINVTEKSRGSRRI